jgi:perosamine synthetase
LVIEKAVMKNMSKKLWRVGFEELEYVRQAIEGGLTGKYTKIFETRFAEKFGVAYAISVNSGTSALHTAMLALDIGPGDEVIVPPLTFIATAYAPLYVGAVPVFADVDPDSFNIDPNQIEAKITPRTKAIITVSLYGLPPDLEKIEILAKKYNLKIIEDNAQCVLGKCNDNIAGTIGDISIFSLQRSKHLTTGDGGVVLTDNEAIAEKCRKFADLGYRTLTAKPISNEDMKEEIQQPYFKRHELVGYNFRMPEVCAAMGLAQLDKIEVLIEKRIEIARLYAEEMEGCNWLLAQKTPENFSHSYWAFVMVLDTEKGVSWSNFRNVFLKHGGEPFYGAWSLSYLEPSLNGMEFHKNNIKYEKGLCPIAESIQPKLIQLKTNFEDIRYGREQALALRHSIKEINETIAA